MAKQIQGILDILTQEEAELLERDLGTWYSSKEEKTIATNKESSLRKDIIKKLFPTPEEGSDNKCILLGGDYMIQVTQGMNYKVDTPSFKSLRDEFLKRGIDADSIVEWEPKFVKAEYNKLSDEDKTFFQQCLIIKEGSVTLDVKPAPKSKS